jgi:hypothetical protein
MTVVLRRILATAMIAALVALAALAGMAALGVDRASSPARPVPLPAAAAPAVTIVRSAATEPKTALDADLAVELDAILAADARPAAGDRATARGQLRRLAAWDRLVHATVVVDLEDGGLTTVQLDHGTISAVSATSLTITEAGGGSVTVALGSETRVRRAGAKAALGDLKAADVVFVMSKVEAGGTSAYLVVVPRR